MILRIGLYLLTGILLNIALGIVLTAWIHKQLDDAELIEKAFDKLMTLKVGLYDKMADSDSVKAMFEHLAEKPSRMIAVLAVSQLFWPFVWAENLAVRHEFVEYVSELKKGGA